MSSGGVVVLPIGVVLAAGAAVVLAAGGAAVLVAYAANQAAEGALRAVGRQGAALEAQAAARCAADRRALEWQAAAADVVSVNARLRLAAHQAQQHRVPVDLPPPLDITGISREDAIGWAARAQHRLAAAQEALDAAADAAQWRHLTVNLPASAVPRSDLRIALAAYRETLRGRRAAKQIRTASTDVLDIDAEIEATLRRLDPDATTAEQTTVLQAAATARAQDDRHDADAYLEMLKKLVLSEVNVRVADRRYAAELLQGLEEQSVAAALADADPPTPFTGTAARLRAVVEDEAELTPRLRAEAKDAAAWAFGFTRRQYLRDLVHVHFAKAGYQIGEELGNGHAMRLSASRSDWHGEHAALLWVAGDGALTGKLVREYEAEGDDAVARDRTRCAELHAVLESLPAGATGMTVKVQPDQEPLRRYRPGQTPDTLVPSRRPAPRTHRKD